jgi:pSer/pThr/pTyr-binding forkhead associated (FHA) protein
MAKLIIKINNEVIDHVELRQGDMKIGRKPGCDIFLDNLSVSGEHANIFTIGEDSFIQDLNSTNGTFINNKRVAKHHLRNGDIITIGKYTLVYMTEPVETRAGDYAKTVIINPIAREEPAPLSPAAPPAAAPTPAGGGAAPADRKPAPRLGALYVLSGTASGKRIDLTKRITNLGKAGRRAGTIARNDDGSYLLAPGADEIPKLNGRPVPAEGVLLKNGDIIEVGGTRLQFYFR